MAQILIREMEPGEAKTIQALGVKTFIRSMESFYVSKPSTAKVAALGDKIVGGLIYTTDNFGDKKLGFIDFFFVDPAYAGRGIGRDLCREGINYLWSEGYDYLAAVVRDDNVGSWAAFKKNGFVNADLPKVARAMGFLGFLQVYFKHWYFFSSACDLHFAPRPESIDAENDDMRSLQAHSDNETLPSGFRKKTGFGQFAMLLLVNLLFVLISTIIGNGFLRWNYPFVDFFTGLFPTLASATFIVFGGTTLFTYLGTLFSGRKWRFRVPTGGFTLCLVISIIGFFFPLGGNLYPDKYENTAKFRRDMGIPALLSWLYIIALVVGLGLFADRLPVLLDYLWAYTSALAVLLLIFRCIPSLHASFGSSRVFSWNKALYVVMLLGSVYLIFFW
ncbi:MAG: GNAT family N-acetyltransferase [Oscillospiraceae bacterium]|nr:GNAT family N-acetyltransferase [Oscillospiraceae bacterium]